MTIGRNRRQFIELDKGNLQVETYDNSARQIAGMEESIDYRKSFRDAHKTFTEEQVKLETARCLGCGASVVDPNKCIGCGACVASCKNASAMLFTSAKIAHLNLLPQGQPERSKRVLAMMKQMEAEGFGNCTNQYECEAACPKGISVDNIARLNRDFMRANAKEGLCF